MRNLTVRTRSFVSFMAITLLVIFIGGFSIWKMQQIRALAVHVEKNSLPSIVIADHMNAAALRLRLEHRRLIPQTDPSVRKETLQRISAAREDFLAQVKSYADYVASDHERALLQTISDGGNKFLEALSSVVSLTEKGQPDEATAYMDRTVVPTAKVMQDAIDALVKLNLDQASADGVASEQAYTSALWLIISVIALATVVTLALAFAFTMSIVKPLRKLMAATDLIARGDLSKSIVADGKDEFTTLMVSSRAMQESLKDTISLIGQSSTQLASAAEEMNAVTDESSRGLARQNVEIEQAATAVNEMTAAVDEVARNASAASDAASESDVSAQVGASNVLRTVKSIEALSATIETTSQEVQQLAVQSQNISKVLSVIGSIAEQTNLLALNAAIEAARAGEQGRGFAVVADEVRALAHRTQASTSEIEQMIAGIMQGTQQATTAMQQSRSQAHETLSIAHEAGAAISQITTSINRINEMNLLIATASEEQAEVARSVDQNLVSIRDLSIQSSAGAHQTAAASAELSRLAIDMNQLVTRFNVG